MDHRPLPGADALYEQAPCGLLLAGPRGELLRVNATLCRWLQYEPADMVGRLRFQDLLTMGGRIFHQTHLAPLLRMQGSVAEVKLEFRRRDGAVLPMMLNASERFHEGEMLLQVSAFVAEDRHRYEQELLAQRRRAEALLQQHEHDQRELALARAQAEDRALIAEQMVGIVSHDLRNPLSAIQMSAVLLGMNKSLEDGQRTVLGRITRSVGRAERLIGDLLDFTQARLGTGLATRPRPMDLHEVLGEAIAELRTAFAEHAIVHQRQGAGDCLADPDRLAQAVGNLVANAVRYGQPGSAVTVRSAGEGELMRIGVHNHGTPIPPEKVQQMFQPMVRGVDGDAPQGVGLGLYIVREIARAHGGEVEVSSSAPEGTCFTLRFPAAGTPQSVSAR